MKRCRTAKIIDNHVILTGALGSTNVKAAQEENWSWGNGSHESNSQIQTT